VAYQDTVSGGGCGSGLMAAEYVGNLLLVPTLQMDVK
jgi:hypothetical protein